MFLSNSGEVLSAVPVSTNPPDGATGVPIYYQISVRFNEAANPSTISFNLSPAVSGTVSYEECEILRYDYDNPNLYFTEYCSRLVFTPSADLSVNTTYTATLSGSVNYTWNFTTGDSGATDTFSRTS